MIQFISVDNNNFYNFAQRIYIESFPIDERRDFDEALNLQKVAPVSFNVVLNNNTPIGILVLWTFPCFLYLEHLAIELNLKGKGFGTKTIEFLSSINKKKLILEVEKPSTEEARKRIQFYQKLGLHLNTSYNYIQPPYNKGKNSIDLYLMSSSLLTKIEYEEVKNTLYREVYRTNDY